MHMGGIRADRNGDVRRRLNRFAVEADLLK